MQHSVSLRLVTSATSPYVTRRSSTHSPTLLAGTPNHTTALLCIKSRRASNAGNPTRADSFYSISFQHSASSTFYLAKRLQIGQCLATTSLPTRIYLLAGCSYVIHLTYMRFWSRVNCLSRNIDDITLTVIDNRRPLFLL